MPVTLLKRLRGWEVILFLAGGAGERKLRTDDRGEKAKSQQGSVLPGCTCYDTASRLSFSNLSLAFSPNPNSPPGAAVLL